MSYVNFGMFQGLGVSVTGSDTVDAFGNCVKGKKSVGKSAINECVKAGVSATAGAACGAYTAGLGAGVCADAAGWAYDGIAGAIDSVFGGGGEKRRKELAAMRAKQAKADGDVLNAVNLGIADWSETYKQIVKFYATTTGGTITAKEVYAMLEHAGSAQPTMLSSIYKVYMSRRDPSAPGGPVTKVKAISSAGQSGCQLNKSSWCLGNKYVQSDGHCRFLNGKCIEHWPEYNTKYRLDLANAAMASVATYLTNLERAKTLVVAKITSQAVMLRTKERLAKAYAASQQAASAARAAAAKAPPKPKAPTGVSKETAARRKAEAAKAARGRELLNVLLGTSAFGLIWRLK